MKKIFVLALLIPLSVSFSASAKDLKILLVKDDNAAVEHSVNMDAPGSYQFMYTNNLQLNVEVYGPDHVRSILTDTNTGIILHTTNQEKMETFGPNLYLTCKGLFTTWESPAKKSKYTCTQ
jgi:hypothetical protein